MEGGKRCQVPVSTLLVSTPVWLSPASDHRGLSCLLIKLCS